MREYAERLAKAAPERFEFVDIHGVWALHVNSGKGHYVGLKDMYNDGVKWSFWGPLADEVYLGRLIDTTCPTCQGMGWVDKPHCESEQLICPRCNCENNCQIPLLEAIADAVCRSFEADQQKQAPPG